MSHAKAAVYIAVLVILAVLSSGLFLRTIYCYPSFHYDKVSSETFTIQPNTTTYRNITLTQQDNYKIIVNTPPNYTILSAALSEDEFIKWQKGQFNASWDGNCYGGGNMYDLAGNNKTYYAGFTEGQTKQTQMLVFWNPDQYSKQVYLPVYTESLEIDQNKLNNANLLIAGGTAGLIGTGLYFAAKNRYNISFSRKKVLGVIACIAMILLGSFLNNTFSNPVHAQTIISQGTVNVAANNYTQLAYTVSQNGDYITQFNVDKGTIQAFHSGDGSIVGYFSNGTEFDIRDEFYPVFNGSSGITGGGFSIQSPYTTYYILSNIDNYSKNVTYQITYQWTYNDYIAMMTGIALTIFGTILLILTVFKGKLKNFNKALENQE